MDILARHTCSSIAIAGLGLMLLLTSGGCIMNEEGAASGALQARGGPVAMICPENLNAGGSTDITVRVIVKGAGAFAASGASLRDDDDGDSGSDSDGSGDSDGDSDSSSDTDGDSDSDSDTDGGTPPMPLDPIRGYSLDLEYNPNHLTYVATDRSAFTMMQPPWAGLSAMDQGDGSDPDIVRITQLIQVGADPVSPNDGELLVLVRFTKVEGAPPTTTVTARNASIGVDGTIPLPDCAGQITF